MPEHPGDIVGSAREALGGICDLLASPERRDLNQVDPVNLLALVELVRHRLAEAEEAIHRNSA